MARYIFKGSRTAYNGAIYVTGDEIEMADASAKSIEDLLTPVSQAQAPAPAPKQKPKLGQQQPKSKPPAQSIRGTRQKAGRKGQSRERASTRR